MKQEFDVKKIEKVWLFGADIHSPTGVTFNVTDCLDNFNAYTYSPPVNISSVYDDIKLDMYDNLTAEVKSGYTTDNQMVITTISATTISATTINHQDEWVDCSNNTLITTGATVTDIATFTPIVDGIYIVDSNTTAFHSSTGNALGAKQYGVFKSSSGVVTQISTTTTDRKTTLSIVLPNIQSTMDTDGTKIRIRANGGTGLTISWRCNLKITR